MLMPHRRIWFGQSWVGLKIWIQCDVADPDFGRRLDIGGVPDAERRDRRDTATEFAGDWTCLRIGWFTHEMVSVKFQRSQSIIM
ncbi:uncharacterized protein LOC116841751 isoform X3 [Odontomachus brunneus]|nr:uncharacterized protein LOC116841751 isoform X3 [Odontomachus brunneus]XP_032665970.1 uncharacterized protein LOC116841751 isoform X3 [Odontomachus brunneus]XP_032665972.1 uncharacterized protein LOC116841751 isoform X3 [Odontomachus brunneus]XP_032665973.1 uncharacterized protein LOC116841751 isoform X3 [Odontomachus brunneus]